MTGFPWAIGDALLASDLNAAISSAGAGFTNVKAFGAAGDGVTNDTAALQAAADAVPVSGGTLALPPGRYAVTGAIRLSSNTLVIGTGATLLAIAGFPVNTAFLFNKNNTATTLTDHDISIHGITFDYATFGTGGSHAIDMIFVTNVIIKDCVFQCRGAGNATACVGSVNTRVEGCSAYGFSNCGYDWWWGPKQAFLINCYAETSASNQMVNFNPEPTSGPFAGLLASGFVMEGCILRATGGHSIPILIEPLAGGTSVSNATVHGNVFTNIYLSMRRAVGNSVISGNVFDGSSDDVEVIRSYAADGGTPSGITVVNNIVNNAKTSGPNYAVIRIEAAPAIVMGNSVIGTGWSGYAYGTGSLATVFLGNIGGPHNTASATGGHGPPTWTA